VVFESGEVFLLFRCVFEGMLMVKANLGVINFLAQSTCLFQVFSRGICMDLGAPFIFFNLYMFLGVFYGVLVVFKYLI
jgi:hypothetical protein